MNSRNGYIPLLEDTAVASPEIDGKSIPSQKRLNAQLWADLHARNRQISHLELEVDAVLRQMERLDAKHNAALAALQLAAEELASVKSLGAWRALASIHAVIGRLPAGPRRHLQRVAKAGYWLVTPHAIPARLRYRKDQRAGLVPPEDINAFVSAEITRPLQKSKNEPEWIPPRPSLALDLSPELGAGRTTQRDTGLLGLYRLAPESRGYTYFAPRLPDNLNCIIAGLEKHSQFSIVVPVYNTPLEMLQRMIRSVEAQWYPHWELILVDDRSTSKPLREALETIRSRDSRILVLSLPLNKGISGATNEGIAAATGDFIVFLDHDDELTEDCLLELACRIDRDNPDFIYSDEDKITADGAFAEPFFKPDWSPDTMMSTMYTCHVSCIRGAVVNAVGGLRAEMDGAQDWDLILRVTEVTNRIAHIAKVLYHWRAIPASVASGYQAKPYVVDAARNLRAEALDRRGLPGTVEPLTEIPGYFRISYAVQGNPDASIIIPSKNNGPTLRGCIDSIVSRTSFRRFEIVVLDNGSTDRETLEYLSDLSTHEKVTIVSHKHEFNWSELNNVGARACRGEFLLFLNDDIEIMSGDWLEQMIGYAQLRHIGAVGAKLVYPNSNFVQHNGVFNLANGPGHAFYRIAADEPGYFARNLLEYNCLAVTGACLMVSRDKFERAGRFNEEFPIAYNDVEFCFRLVDQGLYNLVCQGARLIHYESLTRGSDDVDEAKRLRVKRDMARLYQAHPKYFMRDPFHNPNLHPNDVRLSVPS